MTPDELKARLVDEDLIDARGLPPILPGTPWYIHALGACGAWLASLFLLFVWVVQFGESAVVWAVGGLLQALVAAAMVSKRSPLFTHVSLAFWVTGCGLAAVGVARCAHGSTISYSWAALLTLLGLSFVYPLPLGRLLTLLGSGFVFLEMLSGWHVRVPSDPIVVGLAFVGGFTWLGQEHWWKMGWGSMVKPVGTAAFIILFQILIFSYWGWAGTPVGPVSSALLTCAVLWLEARIVHKLKVPLAGLGVMAGTLAIGLVTYSVPGVMAAVGVLLVGFSVKDKFLQVLAVSFLALFLSAFYYDLSLPLLSKSWTLVALGGMMLFLRRGLVISKGDPSRA